MEEVEEKEIYVYLDFQGKDTSRILDQENVYFRMLNLSESKPIVEISDDVYEGTYDDVVGTNLFFEEIPEDANNENLFETSTPLTLKYILKQSKILKLKKIGTRQKVLLSAPNTESVNINIKDDYRVLLEKFENNKLNIDDYIVDDEEEQTETVLKPTNAEENPINNDYKWELSRSPPRQNLTPNWFKPPEETSNKEELKPYCKNPISLKYTKLQKLAEQPAKRESKQIDTYTQFEEPFNTSPRTDFIIWKNLMMQKVEHQKITVDVQKGKLEDFVDIEQSVKAGVISPSNSYPRIFTKEEKSKLLSFENFANVSPLMKLIMLQDFEDTVKTALDKMSPAELNEIGTDGYNALERYDSIKDFKEELKNFLTCRLQEQYETSDENPEELTFNLQLPDTNEVTYYSSTSPSEDEDEQSGSNSITAGETVELCENES